MSLTIIRVVAITFIFVLVVEYNISSSISDLLFSFSKPPPARLQFLSYKSSPWEEYWTKNVVQYQDNPCEKIKEPSELALSNEWVRQSPIRDNSITFNTTVFSTFTFLDYEGKEFKTYIEPLAGITRHPLTCIDLGQYIFNKDYMQIGCKRPRLAKMKGYKMYYFDLGASLWFSGAGGASQSWIYEQYKWCIKSSENKEPFDGLFMWEAEPQNDSSIWKDIPESVKPIYHYFNEPASTTDPEKNPLNLLRKIVKREDFVILKIDIDNTPVETEFVNQILDSSELLELIDDFFFEHHVNMVPLSASWGTQSAPEKLKDTFDIFLKFRKAGVQAHSWV